MVLKLFSMRFSSRRCNFCRGETNLVRAFNEEERRKRTGTSEPMSKRFNPNLKRDINGWW